MIPFAKDEPEDFRVAAADAAVPVRPTVLTNATAARMPASERFIYFSL
jgi:hypothetical protein